MPLNFGDQKFFDSMGAYLVGELEKLDPKIHEPLVAFTYHRDLPIRSDVTIADEYTSYIETRYGSVGGIRAGGKSWVSAEGNVIATAQVDNDRMMAPMTLWGENIQYTVAELARSQQVNRPIDAQKVQAVQYKHQMDADAMAYVGDADIKQPGLANNPRVMVDAAANGGSGQANWATKTPLEILADINKVLNDAWISSGLALPPSKLLLPPEAMGMLTAPVTSAGDKSIMTYVRENNIFTTTTGRQLELAPVKWLSDIGAGGTGRMVAYTQDEMMARFPLTPLQRTPIIQIGIKFTADYLGGMGVVEIVKPETLRYMDGITTPAAV